MDLSGKEMSDLVLWLERNSNNGDLQASTFLHRMFTEGGPVPADPIKAHKACCLRCLQGDYEETWRMYQEGQLIYMGFPQDHRSDTTDIVVSPYVDPDGLIRTDVPNFLYHGNGRLDPKRLKDARLVRFRHKEPLELLLEMDRDVTLERAGLVQLSNGTCRPKGWESMPEPIPDYYGIWNDSDTFDRDAVEPFLRKLREERNDDAEALYDIARDLFLGHKGFTAPSKALEFALRAAELGHNDARDLIVTMTDSTVYTDSLCYDMKGYEHRGCDCTYPVGDRTLLQDSQEWDMILELTRSEPYGFTDWDEFRNDAEGFEDDVLAIQPYNDWDGDEGVFWPNFTFKPTGSEMWWYKYSWRSGTMSENLTVGEVKHIWRLCIDHLVTGRTFEPCTTEEALRLEPYHAEIPDDLRERIARVVAVAPCTMFDDRGWTVITTYNPCGVHEYTAEMIEELEGRMQDE